jgi:chemotaxis regulatin CheY-phosphate phosphatase CheZ
VVHHFGQAAELVTDAEERVLVARLNLQAAAKAKNSMGACGPLTILRSWMAHPAATMVIARPRLFQ